MLDEHGVKSIGLDDVREPVAALASLVCMTPAIAQAHGALKQSMPAKGAHLTVSPREIRLTFTEEAIDGQVGSAAAYLRRTSREMARTCRRCAIGRGRADVKGLLLHEYRVGQDNHISQRVMR